MFTTWFQEHEPFTKLSGELVSLSCSYVSDDSVNCDQSYEIGIAEIREKFWRFAFAQIGRGKNTSQTEKGESSITGSDSQSSTASQQDIACFGLQVDIYVNDATFVLDGGFLIHYVSWPDNFTHGEIVKSYCE
ncbi:hypothetical protein PR048_021096 [Dryococelus australis]|uniref:Uncharacterized protein n=1 Tax=Dryococelus australis TaxID=614101 RepID=A0ABQ9GX93_9NEOP|nr:hypothetical protein PR048_021096 [Dryococelus australis]